ncbi:hypothetical protein X777_08698 [Ooceraea biroi]|uniref:Uncharacterized protein n=1 Tax=Ooceraea biroi TaxID=2015173 RepID=A0A026W7Z9_OOCBI|nr:hypothetical protein X777_08698 [Ooceraea biroi]
MQLGATRYAVTFVNLVVAGAFRLQTREVKKEKEKTYRQNEWRKRGRSKRERRVGGVETWQDRGAGGRMAVRIYGRFITLPALPRLL